MRKDDLVRVQMYNPHDHDFIYQREDGSYYAEEVREKGDVTIIELDSLRPLNLPVMHHTYEIEPLNKWGQPRGAKDIYGNVISPEDDADYTSGMGLKLDPQFIGREGH